VVQKEGEEEWRQGAGGRGRGRGRGRRRRRRVGAEAGGGGEVLGVGMGIKGSHSGQSKFSFHWEAQVEARTFRKFSLPEIRKMTQNFDPGQQIGRGAFGAVYAKTPSGEPCAVKRSFQAASFGQGAETSDFEKRSSPSPTCPTKLSTLARLLLRRRGAGASV